MWQSFLLLCTLESPLTFFDNVSTGCGGPIPCSASKRFHLVNALQQKPQPQQQQQQQQSQQQQQQQLHSDEYEIRVTKSRMR